MFSASCPAGMASQTPQIRKRKARDGEVGGSEAKKTALGWSMPPQPSPDVAVPGHDGGGGGGGWGAADALGQGSREILPRVTRSRARDRGTQPSAVPGSSRNETPRPSPGEVNQAGGGSRGARIGSGRRWQSGHAAGCEMNPGFGGSRGARRVAPATLEVAGHATAAVGGSQNMLVQHVSPVVGMLTRAVISPLHVVRRLSREGSLLDSGQGPEAADTKGNEEQAAMFDKEGTIWWAISRSGDPSCADKAWEIFQEMTADGVEEPWMSGSSDKDCRGVLGETPLHVLVLLSEPNVHTELGSRQWQMIQTLWRKYPRLRTCVYEGELYRGENVLHIAIVRRLHRDVLRLFVESKEGKELMRMRATGDFFRVPAYTSGAGHVSNGCCHYGELALAFAATTNHRDAFEYLLQQGAALDMVTQNGGHNLLHLIVLHSVHWSEKDSLDDDGAGAGKGGQSEWCREMYDCLQSHMENQKSQDSDLDLYSRLSQQEDSERFVPLTLCAARGSKELFHHMFEKLMVLPSLVFVCLFVPCPVCVCVCVCV